MKARILVLAAALLLALSSSFAQIPRTLSYEGILADSAGAPKPDGTYNFSFRLYTVSSGGASLWNETQSLPVKRGLFSTLLGSVSPIPDSVKFDRQYWLGVQIGAGAELTPRVQMASVGSSFSAVQADVAKTVSDGGLTGAKFAAGQVVKSINNLHDNLTMQGANGASVTASGDTITIAASGGGGSGIAALQNTDNTLAISNPSGPTTTVNLKFPLVLNGNVGIGTSNPTSRLEIAGQDGLAITGYEPFLTLRDGNAGNMRGVIQSLDGGMNLFADSYLSGTNPSAYLCLRNNGNVGIGVANPTGGKLDVNGGGANGASIGIHGSSNDNYGMYGTSNTSFGVFGESGSSSGVRARTYDPSRYAVYADNPSYSNNYCGLAGGSYALETGGPAVINGTLFILSTNTSYISGNLHVSGSLEASGTKSFRIDHPTDPANRFLVHSSVESNERLDIYSGTVVTDGDGSATVQLPSYFHDLNVDYRYQLTVVGEDFAQARVSRKIDNNRFSIKTDKPHIEISWQVTGTRNDPYARAHPFVTEEEKGPDERGKFLHPELVGQPKEKGIGYRQITGPSTEKLPAGR